MVNSRELDADVCAVGWSMGGSPLGAADCPPDETATVSVWSVTDGSFGASADLAAAPIASVDSISVSDDGAVVSVSRPSCESAVSRDGEWIPDARLNAAASSTNDYHTGWSMVDESGSGLLVRKNQDGIVLWSIGDDGVSPTATILDTDPYKLPVVPMFNSTTLHLAWIESLGGDLKSPQVREWDLSPGVLAEPLCLWRPPALSGSIRPGVSRRATTTRVPTGTSTCPRPLRWYSPRRP